MRAERVGKDTLLSRIVPRITKNRELLALSERLSRLTASRSGWRSRQPARPRTEAHGPIWSKVPFKKRVVNAAMVSLPAAGSVKRARQTCWWNVMFAPPRKYVAMRLLPA